MRTAVDAAVRKLLAKAGSDPVFATELSVAPVQTIHKAQFLTSSEKALLSQTAPSWAPSIAGAARLARLPSSTTAEHAHESLRLLSAVNESSLNHLAHLVRPTETLETIAQLYTGRAELWPELESVNRIVGPPRPGTVLAVPTGWGGQFGNVQVTALELYKHMTRIPSVPAHLDPGAPPTHGRRPPRSKAPKGQTLDIKGFGNSLLQAMEAIGVAGCMIQMRQSGNIVYDSRYRDAIFEWDPQGPRPWSSSQMFDAGSTGKFITALALVQITSAALDAQYGGVSLTDGIASFLPRYWTVDASLQDIQFVDLLRHQSGFQTLQESPSVYLPNQFNPSPALTEFESYKALAAKGVPRPAIASWAAENLGVVIPIGNQASRYWHYCNENYGMMRVLMGNMTGDTLALEEPAALIGYPIDTLWDLTCIKSYSRVVAEFVNGMAGLPAPRLVGVDTDARAYLTLANFSPPSPDGQLFSNGVETGDNTEAAGYGGLYQSVNTLLEIMESFINGNMLRSNYPYEPYDVLDNGFGVDDINVDFPRWGTYYDKNGGAPRSAVSWEYENYSGPQQPPTVSTGIQTLIYFMPEDIRLALVANSAASAQPDLRSLVHDALEANLHEAG